MARFPLFFNLSNWTVLVVGGGKVATRKVRSLLSFGPAIEVVTVEASDEIERWSRDEMITLFCRPFEEDDLLGKNLVVVAVDDVNLQEEIWEDCQNRGILCNGANLPDGGDCAFGGIIERGDVVVAVNSGVPALTRILRQQLEEALPEELDAIQAKLARVREEMVPGKKRRRALGELARRLMGEG